VSGTNADPMRMGRRGDVLENRVTGERALTLVGTGDGKGDRLAALVTVLAGGRVAGEHYHPSLTERFRVLSGRLQLSLDGRRQTVDAGGDVTIPPGVVHDFWNDSDEDVEILVDVRPGRCFELMISTLWGLANDGKTNAQGLPGPLRLAVIAREFRDIIRFTKPPALVQRTVLPLLAALGRARGYRPYYPEYLEPQGHEEPPADLIALAC
jgi:quercetin dioxygenase-like cupin family protein